MKTKYVISRSHDLSEWSVTSWENWDRDKVRVDTDGLPLVVVKIFDAESWEKAKEIFEEARDGERAIVTRLWGV